MANARRLYLRVTLKLLILLGLGLAAIPFISSLQHAGDDAGDASNPWMIEVDLSRLAEGQILSVPWPGGEVWIHHRTRQDIQYLQTIAIDNLRDPVSDHSDQPDTVSINTRSLRPEYFVFLPRETRRGCQVQQIELQAGITGYSEACYGARFDNAGRILQGSGQADQHNLSIPPHEFSGPTSLRLLPRAK
jgi:ubiquinol-cytochrome c reductase iron-sulfur subunit